MSCDPNTLSGLSRCFSCLPRISLARVRTWILCKMATGSLNAGASPVNVIAGQNYAGGVQRYTFLGATPGQTYQLIWGANDRSVSSATAQVWNTPAAGLSSIIRAPTNQLVFQGYANGPVTAQLYAITL